MGMNNLKNIRQGKHLAEVDENDAEVAQKIGEMCKKLLVNWLLKIIK